jgi:hypothetical protein
LAIPIVLIAALASLTPAFAHENRAVGSIHTKVGWGTEPTYTGTQNAIQLFVTDASNAAVPNVDQTVKVEVTTGSAKTDMLALQPSDEDPTLYFASLTPTRPGVYSFHFVGTIAGQPFDQTYTSSDSTFDTPKAPTEIEFPVKDPTIGQLDQRVSAVDARDSNSISTLSNQLSQTTTIAYVLGAVGIVLAIIALVLGGLLYSRRTRSAETIDPVRTTA